MGYAVLHLEKAKGADGAMSTHIERTVHPKNADRTRTHLNRVWVRINHDNHLIIRVFCFYRAY